MKSRRWRWKRVSKELWCLVEGKKDEIKITGREGSVARKQVTEN